MKKFRFTLQPVATLRSLQEMRASDAFARANRELAACEAALSVQQLRVAHFVESLIVRRTTGLPAALHDSFMRAYRNELAEEKAAGEARAQAERAQEAARQRWIEAHLQVKLVDKLRVRARERHQVELVRAEQRQLDDRLPRGVLFPESS